MSQDEGDKRTRAKDSEPSTVHDIVTGGIEGAVGSLAVDPLIQKVEHGAFTNPLRAGWLRRTALYGGVGATTTGLIGALVSMTSKKAKRKKEPQEPVQMELIPSMLIELSDVPRAEKHGKAVTAAGVGAAALGISALPGAAKFIGIRGRAAVGRLGFPSANPAGRFVANYIEGAQQLLNTGVRGKALGKVVQNAIEQPRGVIAKGLRATVGTGPSGKAEDMFQHFARFRSSPMNALNHWDMETITEHSNRWARQDAAAVVRGKPMSQKAYDRRKEIWDTHAIGREKVHAAIKEQLTTGKNEMEAIKHVAYNNSDPHVQTFFGNLAQHKEGVSKIYGAAALASPALIAAGGAGIVVGRKKDQTPRQAIVNRTPFRELERLVEYLNQFDYPGDLRSGVRLDKYKKQIKGREIDRHIHDYLRSAAIGSVAGAVIPAPGGLKARIIGGAGAGTLVAGVLHAAGHVDPYGEQSEEAKITQRTVPKYAGAAVVIGGLVARFRKRNVASALVHPP
jgi:hypothetical protein